MSKLAELLEQQIELEKQIKEAAKTERSEALKTVKKLCKQYGFTASMLQSSLASGRVRKSKTPATVAAKTASKASPKKRANKAK